MLVSYLLYAKMHARRSKVGSTVIRAARDAFIPTQARQVTLGTYIRTDIGKYLYDGHTFKSFLLPICLGNYPVKHSLLSTYQIYPDLLSIIYLSFPSFFPSVIGGTTLQSQGIVDIIRSNTPR